MTWTPIRLTERRSHIRETEVMGCALTLVYSSCDGVGGVLLSLDRAPATYTRSVTDTELAALARLNPEDEAPVDARPVLSDLMLALAALRRDAAPLGARERAEIGRVASALMARAFPASEVQR